jgi:hypothetical protein
VAFKVCPVLKNAIALVAPEFPDRLADHCFGGDHVADISIEGVIGRIERDDLIDVMADGKICLPGKILCSDVRTADAQIDPVITYGTYVFVGRRQRTGGLAGGRYRTGVQGQRNA